MLRFPMLISSLSGANLRLPEYTIGVFVRCAEGGEGGGVKLSFFV